MLCLLLSSKRMDHTLYLDKVIVILVSSVIKHIPKTNVLIHFSKLLISPKCLAYSIIGGSISKLHLT